MSSEENRNVLDEEKRRLISTLQSSKKYETTKTTIIYHRIVPSYNDGTDENDIESLCSDDVESLSTNEDDETLNTTDDEMGEIATQRSEDSKLEEIYVEHKKPKNKDEKDENSLTSTVPNSSSSDSYPSINLKNSSFSFQSTPSLQARLRLYNQGLERIKRSEERNREQEVRKKKPTVKASELSITAGCRLYNLAAEKQKKLNKIREEKYARQTAMSKTVSNQGRKKYDMKNASAKPRFQQLYELGKQKNEGINKTYHKSKLSKPKYPQPYGLGKEKKQDNRNNYLESTVYNECEKKRVHSTKKGLNVVIRETKTVDRKLKSSVGSKLMCGKNRMDTSSFSPCKSESNCYSNNSQHSKNDLIMCGEHFNFSWYA